MISRELKRLQESKPKQQREPTAETLDLRDTSDPKDVSETWPRLHYSSVWDQCPPQPHQPGVEQRRDRRSRSGRWDTAGDHVCSTEGSWKVPLVQNIQGMSWDGGSEVLMADCSRRSPVPCPPSPVPNVNTKFFFFNK